jgi:hypothetical protein
MAIYLLAAMCYCIGEKLSFLDFFKKGKKEGPSAGSRTTITNINIRLGGDVHSLPGRDVGDSFDLTIPYKNTIGNGLLPDNLKGPDVTVSQITIDKPFELVECKPNLPINIPYMSQEKFALKIKAPNYSYNGPMVVKFDTSSKENIDVNVSKIMFVHGTKRVELESSAFNMNIKKGQVFKRDIQLYKILSFGQEVKAIEISKQFEIADCNPKAPFKLDAKDSYIVSLFIKCPDFSYAGEMEIYFR